MGIIKYFSDVFKNSSNYILGRHVSSTKKFIDRYEKDIKKGSIEQILGDRTPESLKGKTIDDLFRGADEEQQKRMRVDLEGIANDNYKKHWEPYHKKPSWSSSFLRYAGLGLGGASLYLGAMALFGGPAAIAGIPLAMKLLGYAGASHIGADVIDAYRADRAVSGEKSFLGYVKKKASGIWDTVTSPFRSTKDYAKRQVKEKTTTKALVEGVATNVAAKYAHWPLVKWLGPYLLGATPYATLMTHGLTGVAFYRGRRKFDDIVLQKVQGETQRRFLEKYLRNYLKQPEPVHQAVPVSEPIRRPGLIPVAAAYNTGMEDQSPVYQIAQQRRHGQTSRDLGYVAPRRRAA